MSNTVSDNSFKIKVLGGEESLIVILKGNFQHVDCVLYSSADYCKCLRYDSK